jgi:hypothetical protein
MLWSRSDRDARRQKVLDELLELDAEHRRRRLELAVAAGEVHSSEMAATMQLVNRLEALRLMTVPIGGTLPGGRSSRPDQAPVAVAVVTDDGPASLAEAMAAFKIQVPAESEAASTTGSLEKSEPSISWLRP